MTTRALYAGANPHYVERARRRRCSRCGCTDDRACAGGCFWIRKGSRPICSACASPQELRAFYKKLDRGPRQ